MRSYPAFVPSEHFEELRKISKDRLMDMIWDMAKQLTPPDDDGNEAPNSDVVGIVRHELEVVNTHRTR